MTRPRSFRSALVAVGVLALTLAGLVASQPALAAPAPEGLRTAEVAARAVGLTWKAVGEGAYRVRMSTSPAMASPRTWDVIGNYVEWTRLIPNPNAVSPRLAPHTTYYFQVKAIAREQAPAERSDLSGYSKPLAVRTAGSDRPPELAPVEPRITAGGATRLYVSWRTRGPGVSYAVRYSSNPATAVSTWKTRIVPTNGVTIEGLKTKTRYYVRVQVVRGGKVLSAHSERWAGNTAAATPSPGLSLVSYNILKTGGSHTWASRRAAVAATISGLSPDIVALQEAIPTAVTSASGKRVPQYTDVLHTLGHRYAYVTGKGSSGTRLAYNTTRLSVVSSDAVTLTTLGPSTRYAVWAVLRDKVSGKKVFVVDTHLEPPGTGTSAMHNNARIKQAKEILGLIKKRNTARLPVLVAGDLNSSRSTQPGNGSRDTFVAGGLVDPLGNATGSWLSGQRASAEHLLDVEYNSYNNFERRARRTPWALGTDVDYVLVSPGVRVAQYRKVVSLDPEGRFVGTIPSDHNALGVVVHLP